MVDAALRETGCPSDMCDMVGDSEVNDIEPALSLGMRATRVAIEEPAPTSSAAHAVVSNLADAGRIIAAWTKPSPR